MKITPVEHHIDLLASDLVRSPGRHMSELYGALYEDLEPDRFIKDSVPNPLMLALGTAWELHFERLLAKSGVPVKRMGEFISPEGIAYSPDGIIENGHLTVFEYKLTWMSAKDEIEHHKYARYFTQLKLYCYHLETLFARLYVLFVCGNYKPPTPLLRVYDVEFAARELQEEWQTVVNHSRHKGLL